MNTREIIYSLHHQPYTWSRGGCVMAHSSGVAIYLGAFDADPPPGVMATRWERFLIWFTVHWFWCDCRKSFKFAPSRLSVAMKMITPDTVNVANEFQLWEVANDPTQ